MVPSILRKAPEEFQAEEKEIGVQEWDLLDQGDPELKQTIKNK